MRCLSLSLLSSIAALIGLAVNPAQATILTFTQTGAPNQASYETTLAAYGDNVNSTTQIVGPLTFGYGQGNAFTPNIAMSYAHTAGGGNLGPIYYADGVWVNPVNYLHAFSGSQHFLTFTPDLGNIGVQLNSMVFDLYNSIGQPVNASITWNIRALTNTGTILNSGVETGWTTGENRLIDLGQTTYFGTTVLEILLTTVGSGSVSIDDLNFDQVEFLVPEPGTLTLGAFGLAVLAGRPRGRMRAAA